MSSPRRMVIAGLPRCGTTLLASLLNQQAGCRLVMDYVNWARDARDRLGQGWASSLDLSQRRVALSLARDAWLRFKHPVLVTTAGFRTIDELDRCIATELAADGRVAAVGYKMLLEPEDIRSLLDETDVHVVVVMRDPRDAALSYYHRVGASVERYLGRWRRMVRFCEQTSAPRFEVLRFEELLVRPQHTLSHITRWWTEEAPIVPARLMHERGPAGGVEWRDNSAFGDVSQPLDPAPLARWRHIPRSPIVRYADAVCRREMLLLGMEPLDQPLGTRARARLHELYWELEGRFFGGVDRARGRLRRRLAPPVVEKVDADT